MSQLIVRAGEFTFQARFEAADAPRTIAAFRRLLPLQSRIIHVRWSGEGGWIPFGDLDLGLGVGGLTVLAAWGLGELFATRAAFLQVGAMLGTIMAGNVLFVIIPAHAELVRARLAGR